MQSVANIQMLRTSSTLPLFGLGVVLALTVFAYWAGMTGGFVLDDFHNIVENPSLRVNAPTVDKWLIAVLSSESGPLQRPLSMLSFAINYYFTGMDPAPMKVTNLLIHLINTVLVYGLVRAIASQLQSTSDIALRYKWVPLFVAGAWALHPINLMAVLYVVQRMESLCHIFVFSGLWLYVYGRSRQSRGSKGWIHVIVGLVGGTSLGVLCKESAILLPLYAFFLELTIFRFRHRDGVSRNIALYSLYFFILILPALIAVIWMFPPYLAPGSYGAREFTLGERLLTECRVVMQYLAWTIVPDLNQLSIHHDDFVISRGLLEPITTALSIIGIALLGLTAWIIRRSRPLASLGLLWFFSAHALTATFIPLELVFEHRNYFASVGVCLVFADILLVLPSSDRFRRAGIVASAAFLFGFAGLTFLRASEWSSPLRFAVTEAAKHPTSPRATNELARNLVALTGYDVHSPVLPAAWAALERARDTPRSTTQPNQAALVLAARLEIPQQRIWWQDMQHKLRTQPMNAANIYALVALSNCAVEAECAFAQEDMLATFGAALHRSHEPGVLSIFGKYALYVMKDPALALRLWTEASNASPSNPQFVINLAMLQIDLGLVNESRQQISRLRQLGRLGRFEAEASDLEYRLDAQIRAQKAAPGSAASLNKSEVEL